MHACLSVHGGQRTRLRKRPLCATLLLALGAHAAHAAVITVDSSGDGSVPGQCTVRDAVAAANTDAAVAGCTAGSGADTVRFADGVNDVLLTSAAGGTLFFSDALTLDGEDTLVTLRRDSSDAPFRILESVGQTPLALRWMKITGGRADPETPNRGGAGVLAYGDLEVSNSEVSGNLTTQQYGRGGGIVGHGNLNVADSVISGNATTGPNAAGGGLYGYAGATLTRTIVSTNATTGDGSAGGGIALYVTANLELDGCTIAGNSTSGSSSSGGGLNVTLGTLTMTDSSVSGNTTMGDWSWGGGAYSYEAVVNSSTLSGNSTSGNYSYGGGGLFSASLVMGNSTVSGNATSGEGSTGGGIAVALAIQLGNSTIFANSAELAEGGGVHFWSMPVAATFTSSIVFGNSAAVDADIGFEYADPLAVGGSHNLIGVLPTDVEFPDDTLNCDPLLLPLAANGGFTMTHALAEGSCAIDAGANPDALTSDQRGAPYVRAFGVAADIGAFEEQPRADGIFSDGFD